MFGVGTKNTENSNSRAEWEVSGAVVAVRVLGRFGRDLGVVAVSRALAVGDERAEVGVFFVFALFFTLLFTLWPARPPRVAGRVAREVVAVFVVVVVLVLVRVAAVVLVGRGRAEFVGLVVAVVVVIISLFIYFLFFQ